MKFIFGIEVQEQLEWPPGAGFYSHPSPGYRPQLLVFIQLLASLTSVTSSLSGRNLTAGFASQTAGTELKKPSWLIWLGGL